MIWDPELGLYLFTKAERFKKTNYSEIHRPQIWKNKSKKCDDMGCIHGRKKIKKGQHYYTHNKDCRKQVYCSSECGWSECEFCYKRISNCNCLDEDYTIPRRIGDHCTYCDYCDESPNLWEQCECDPEEREVELKNLVDILRRENGALVDELARKDDLRDRFKKSVKRYIEKEDNEDEETVFK
jgi:hypothetical protein